MRLETGSDERLHTALSHHCSRMTTPDDEDEDEDGTGHFTTKRDSS